MASPDDFINVGGIRYTLHEEKPGVNYYFRSYNDFRSTFTIVAQSITDKNITFDRIKQLFIKYMRVEPFMEQDFGAVDPADKPDLIEILKAYLTYLENSMQIAGISIASGMIANTFLNITKNLESLTYSKGRKKNESKSEDGISVSADSCETSKAKLRGLPKNFKEQMVLEITWLLDNENLNKNFTEKQCEWAEMVSKLADIRLGDITELLPPRNESKESSGSPEQPLPSDSSSSGSPEQPLPSDSSSSGSPEQPLPSDSSSSSLPERPLPSGSSDDDRKYDEDGNPIRSSQITEHGGGAMNSRIKTLLTVSHIAQMSKKPFTQTGGGSATDDLYDILHKELSLALLPLFDSIKSMYQPVYGMLESCMIHSRVKKRTILEPLLTLLHISNHFVTSTNSHGIYRIRNGGKDLVHFITTQLQCTAARIQNMTPAKRKKYLESIERLSPFIISSLPKRKAVSPLKKAPPLPTVHYLTLDGNLTIPPFERFYRKGSESEKESTFQAMTDFFTADDIYMAYSSDETPMNLYEIDFSSISTMDTHIPITTHDSYFTSHPHHLQQFAPLVENALYTNGELMLSIFIALKEKRSK